MSEFLLQRDNSPGLTKWVHTEECARQNNNQVREHSCYDTGTRCLRSHYIPYRTFDWVVKDENVTVNRTDPSFKLGGQKVYAEKIYLVTGSIYWLNLQLTIQNSRGKHSRENGVTHSRRNLWLPGTNYFFHDGWKPH